MRVKSQRLKIRRHLKIDIKSEYRSYLILKSMVGTRHTIMYVCVCFSSKYSVNLNYRKCSFIYVPIEY